MQDSEREAFAAVLNGLVLDRQNYLVCGCDITVNDNTHKVSMTSGWCFYQGELLPVKALPATSFTGNRPLVKLTKVTEYDSAGDRMVYHEGVGTTVHVWEQDCLVPSVVGEGENYTLALSEGAWTLAERIRETVKATDTGIVPLEMLYSGLGNINYRRVGGTVQLYGFAKDDVGGSVSGQIATNLPRPTVQLRIPLSNGYLTLDTNGTLTANTSMSQVYFDSITYLTTPSYNSSDGHHSSEQQEEDETL